MRYFIEGLKTEFDTQTGKPAHLHLKRWFKLRRSMLAMHDKLVKAGYYVVVTEF